MPMVVQIWLAAPKALKLVCLSAFLFCINDSKRPARLPIVSVKPSPAKTNRLAPTSLPVCLIIIIVFFGKIHPFPKCSLAFSVAFVQKQIAVWIIKLFRLLPLLEKCGFYNLKYPTVEIFARCGTICFYAVQDKISKEIFLVHRITVF